MPAHKSRARRIKEGPFKRFLRLRQWVGRQQQGRSHRRAGGGVCHRVAWPLTAGRPSTCRPGVRRALRYAPVRSGSPRAESGLRAAAGSRHQTYMLLICCTKVMTVLTLSVRTRTIQPAVPRLMGCAKHHVFNIVYSSFSQHPVRELHAHAHAMTCTCSAHERALTCACQKAY